MAMDRDNALKAFQELIDNVQDFADNDLIVLDGEGDSDALLPDAIAALAVLSGTCATCSNCTAAGSCDLDILDPQGDEIENEPIKNWRNRDTFGCVLWTAKQEGASS